MLGEIRRVCACKITHSAFESFVFDMLCIGVSFYVLVSPSLLLCTMKGQRISYLAALQWW